jgi:zinc D-Ala-D-Ala dipeptidase
MRVSPYALAATLLLSAPAHARERLPPGFVYLRDIDSSIAQDMRYATADNFTGRPLPGYAAAECILRREAAEALRRVQADLAKDSLSLKVYDCYRPTRAVRAMESWAFDNDESASTRRFYPALPKRNLFRLGYIAAQSKHSTGTTVDLTLVKLPAAPAPAFDPAARYGPCTGPANKRAPDSGIDMGTAFDCFDVRSYSNNKAITPEQKRWRGTLNTAMHRSGFVNYFREWWHYSYPGALDPRAYDFAIGPRGR